MQQNEHLTHQLLVAALDDELPREQASLAEQHLSQCETCRREYEKLRTLTVRLGAFFGSAQDGSAQASPAAEHVRASLCAALEAQAHPPRPRRRPKKLVWGLGWGAAIAAGLAMAALFAPWPGNRQQTAPQGFWRQANGIIEMDGEHFIALPYSNPDLPIGAPRIVEMDVPVRSLADAGISFEPISAQAANPGASVLADVLIGLDGEPLGIHVLSRP